MENIKNLVEQIFSHAVALDQNGGLKNTIYAIDNEVFILNYDHTVLLRFLIRQEDVPFKDPVAFKASDYDSSTFEERNGRITFFSKDGEYERKKTCGTSDMTPAEVQELYLQYVTDRTLRQTVQLTKNVLGLLDDSLSHIEFSGTAGESLKMIQRNIYSGGVIEVQKSNKGLFKDHLTEDFGPVGMKTEDFRALFAFQDVLNFSFPSRGKEDFILVKRGESKNTLNMTGVIACCLYDEIIEIREARSEQTKTKMVRSK